MPTARSYRFDAQGRFLLIWRCLLAFLGTVLFYRLFAFALWGKHAGGDQGPLAIQASTVQKAGLTLALALLWWILANLRAADLSGRLRNGWKAAAFIVLSGVLSTVGFLLLGKVGTMGGVVLSLTAGLLTSWICTRAEGNPFASIGYKMDGRWARELTLGTLGGAGIMMLTALLTLGFGGFHWIRGTATLGVAAWGFLLYVLVGFNEETLFRGYLFQRLVKGMGEWPTQALLAGLFAFAHWGNPGMHGATKAWASLNIALAAVLLGLCYLRTRCLALPIGVHLGWNWTQGNLLGFGVSGTTDTPGLFQPVFHGRPEWLTGGAFGLEASLPCALVCLAAIIALMLWKREANAVPSTALEA
ncbi:MAG TPA: CPBP family intramembrane glutamic endopeptidase [Geothrix sp.]|nr:CPBP family intramembrane glutamic endopeptidase [Geothrix sp.]